MEEFYKKKIIRDFLSLFSESKWKNLCILCIEYGILQLKKNYQISSLSMDDIEQFVDDLIEEDAKKQKKNLRKFGVAKQNTSSNSNTTINNNRPSSNWRKGDTKSIFDNDEEENIYTNTMKTSNANNDYSFNSKLAKEKLLDEILYPKQKKIVNYPKEENIFPTSKTRIKNDSKNYTSTYNNTYSNTQKTYQKQRSSVSQNRKLVNSNSNSNMKFSSGLQMLKMRTPSKKISNGRSISNNRGNRYDGNFQNVSSKIKNQVEADRKIYEMLKKKKREEKKTFEDRESSITYRKSEMSFEEGFSSLV